MTDRKAAHSTHRTFSAPSISSARATASNNRPLASWGNETEFWILEIKSPHLGIGKGQHSGRFRRFGFFGSLVSRSHVRPRLPQNHRWKAWARMDQVS